MAKHTWTDNELITKDLLNSIEDRIEAKAQRGETGPQGPQGERGPAGPQGPKGADAVIQKLDAVEDATEEIADLAGKFNTLIQGLKAKGYMNS